jgi:hypothetical protein
VRDELVAVIEAAAARGEVPVVVFDLDSTLIDTAHRHLRILREHAMHEGDAAFSAVVDRLGPSDMGWEVEHGVRATGYGDEALIARLRERWWSTFFTDEYCAGDLPHPGGPELVRAAWAAGAVVVYLSARSAHSMARGTVETLLRWGFPLYEGRAVVHLRTERKQADTAFKSAAVEALRAMGTVVATFENEPAHTNHFAASFPGALHVLVDTVHSPGAPAPRPDVRVIRDLRGA